MQFNWRLLDRNNATGIDTWHAYDADTNETLIKTTPVAGAVDDVVEANKAAYNDGTNGYISKSREMKRVASIPTWVQHKWLVEEGIDIMDKNAWPAVKRKLNSNEWRYLRTSGGDI